MMILLSGIGLCVDLRHCKVIVLSQWTAAMLVFLSAPPHHCCPSSFNCFRQKLIVGAWIASEYARDQCGERGLLPSHHPISPVMVGVLIQSMGLSSIPSGKGEVKQPCGWGLAASTSECIVKTGAYCDYDFLSHKCQREPFQ